MMESWANRPINSVARIPHTRGAGVAPAGSSIFPLSNIRTAETTTPPAIKPMITELPTLTKAQGAVIATSPASAPFRVSERSGFPSVNQAARVALKAAAAAALLVVTAIRAMSAQEAAMVLPGLKPNHPNQSTKQPIVADVILWPGIGLTFPSFVYFPIRGPSMMIPASAAHPPTEWTTGEPAKSHIPSFCSHPPPHPQ